jgi:hypothetical protein
MKEYRSVASFYYKNQKYLFLLDEKDNNFFLRVIDDDKYSYCTIEEFVELQKVFSRTPNVMDIEKQRSKIRKFIPMIIVGSTLLKLSLPLSIGMAAYVRHQYKGLEKDKEIIPSYTTVDENYDHEKVQAYIEKNAPEELDPDYVEGTTYVTITDSSYLDKVFDYKTVSVDEIKKAIANNNDIPSSFKGLINEYVDSIAKKYPKIELRIFYENIKDLKVVECDKFGMLEKTLNINASGCYVAKENTIYVFEDKEYKKGTWDYQVIYHELSHCLRTRNFDKDGKHYRLKFAGNKYYNTTTEEALNSLFTVSLFDYEEKDIAYQLQSNIHSVMIESMDNYSLEDYANHSYKYYVNKLDEFNGDNNYASTILSLMELQYKDYHSDEIKVEQSEYYPLYRYVSDMYYKKRINSNMSYEDAKKVTEELVAKITYDVPKEYNIDENYFYEYLKEYCKKVGIQVKTY